MRVTFKEGPNCDSSMMTGQSISKTAKSSPGDELAAGCFMHMVEAVWCSGQRSCWCYSDINHLLFPNIVPLLPDYSSFFHASCCITEKMLRNSSRNMAKVWGVALASKFLGPQFHLTLVGCVAKLSPIYRDFISQLSELKRKTFAGALVPETTGHLQSSCGDDASMGQSCFERWF